jgi:hypothetical protein
VELTPALTADLAALTAALDDPDVDLEAGVNALGDSVRGTVESLLGVSLTVVVDGYPFTVSTLDGAEGADGAPVRVGSSLRMPIPVGDAELVSAAVTPWGGAPPASTLVLYAATPGAFVDLAADLTYALQWPVGVVVLDADLHPAGGGGLGAQLEGLSVIHQAVGVLIGRGDTPEGAWVELVRRAVSSRVDVGTAATDVVASTGP